MLGGDTVEPVASYYAGVGWSTAQDRQRARAALTRVVREWPGTSWATQAQRRLDELGADDIRWWGTSARRFRVRQQRRAPGTGRAAARGDLQPARRARRLEWPDRRRAVPQRELGSGRRTQLRGHRVSQRDELRHAVPRLAAWIDRSLDEATTLRLAADGGYAWVAYEPFYITQRGESLAAAPVDRRGLVRALRPLLARQLFEDERRRARRPWDSGRAVPAAAGPIPFCGPPGLDEHQARNRDGDGTSFGVLHTLPIPFELPYGGATARFGYQYDRFIARGTEYTYQAHSVAGGLRVGLPWQRRARRLGKLHVPPVPQRHDLPEPAAHLRRGVRAARRTGGARRRTPPTWCSSDPINGWLSASARWHLESEPTRPPRSSTTTARSSGAYLTATFGN